MKTNWKIFELKRKTDTGLVFEVTYVINFELKGKNDRHIGNLELEGDVNDPNFIPYENLTEEIVLNWIQSELGQDKIDEIQTAVEDRIRERIEREKNPPFKRGLPWNNQNQ